MHEQTIYEAACRHAAASLSLRNIGMLAPYRIGGFSTS